MTESITWFHTALLTSDMALEKLESAELWHDTNKLLDRTFESSSAEKKNT